MGFKTKFLNTGTSKALPHERQRIQILNTVILSSQFVTLSYALVFLYLGAVSAALIDFLVIISGFLAFYLNRLGLNRISSMILLLSIFFQILFLSFVFISNQVGLHFYLLGLASVGFLILPEKEYFFKYIFSALCLAFFPIIEYMSFKPILLYEFTQDQNELFHLASYLCAGSYITVFTLLFKKLLNNSEKKIKKDLSISKKIQRTVLSVEDKNFDETDFKLKYIPMTEVGGDFYTISKIKDKVFRIFLADATGHGVQAALITMVIKGVYDNIPHPDLSISQTIEIFNNNFITKYGNLNTFLTAILVDLDLEQNTITFVSAGHPSAILQRESEQILLKNTGKMLGVKKNIAYQEKSLDFLSNDRLYLFTDGMFEQFNYKDEEFGETRLHSILQAGRALPLEKVLQNCLSSLEVFLDGRESQDDITILGIAQKERRG